jgi:hypothetical protein
MSCSRSGKQSSAKAPEAFERLAAAYPVPGRVADSVSENVADNFLPAGEVDQHGG